jgi:hypothetical protein
MPSRNENFPWTSHYGHYKYFEARMAAHDKVISTTPHGNGIYKLDLVHGDTLRIFICECYAFGVAEYMETDQEIGPIDAVIINSAWCGYTPDAKRHCRDMSVGLFTIGEFMRAINKKEYWTYLTDEEKEYFENQGWL